MKNLCRNKKVFKYNSVQKYSHSGDFQKVFTCDKRSNKNYIWSHVSTPILVSFSKVVYVEKLKLGFFEDGRSHFYKLAYSTDGFGFIALSPRTVKAGSDEVTLKTHVKYIRITGWESVNGQTEGYVYLTQFNVFGQIPSTIDESLAVLEKKLVSRFELVEGKLKETTKKTDRIDSDLKDREQKKKEMKIKTVPEKKFPFDFPKVIEECSDYLIQAIEKVDSVVQKKVFKVGCETDLTNTQKSLPCSPVLLWGFYSDVKSIEVRVPYKKWTLKSSVLSAVLLGKKDLSLTISDCFCLFLLFKKLKLPEKMYLICKYIEENSKVEEVVEILQHSMEMEDIDELLEMRKVSWISSFNLAVFNIVKRHEVKIMKPLKDDAEMMKIKKRLIRLGVFPLLVVFEKTEIASHADFVGMIKPVSFVSVFQENMKKMFLTSVGKLSRKERKQKEMESNLGSGKSEENNNLAVKVKGEKSLGSSKEKSNIVLCCNGKQINAHVEVLLLRSSYFRRSLGEIDLKKFKARTLDVEFDYFGEATLLSYLEYLYLGTISDCDNIGVLFNLVNLGKMTNDSILYSMSVHYSKDLCKRQFSEDPNLLISSIKQFCHLLESEDDLEEMKKCWRDAFPEKKLASWILDSQKEKRINNLEKELKKMKLVLEKKDEELEGMKKDFEKVQNFLKTKFSSY